MLRVCLAVWLIVGNLLNTAGAEDRQLPIMELDIQGHIIIAELAETASARTTGLMHRTHLPEDVGMFFIFPVAGIHCMWMQNTLIPLSVAFLDESRKIVNLARMQPETLTPHCSTSAAKYALEMNTNWFDERKIKAGDKIVTIPAEADRQ